MTGLLRQSRMFLLLALLATAGALGFCPSAAKAAEGYWKLVDTDIDMDPRKDGLAYGTPSIGKGEYVVTGSFYERGTRKLLDQWIVGISWTAMPRVLRAGQKLPITIRARSIRRPKVFVGMGGSTAGGRLQSMRADGTWPSFLVGGIPGADGKKHAAALRYGPKDPMSDSVRLVAGIPPGRKGAKICLAPMLFHTVQQAWMYRYVYAWQSGPVPANPGPPVKPGEEVTPEKEPPVKPTPVKPTPVEPKPVDPPKPPKPVDPPKPPKPVDPPQPPEPVDPPKPPRTVVIPGLTLRAEKRTVKAGQSVFVPLWLLKADRIGNINVEVSYDPSIVRPAGKAMKGNLIGEALFDTNPGEVGKMYVGFATSRGLSGDGTIAQMKFQAVGKPGQRAPLTLRVTKIDTTENAVPEIILIDGEIEILTESGQKLGDADDDGKITLADAMLALQMSIKLIPEKLVCDVDRSGSVTSKDARLLIDMAWEDQK